MLMLPPLHLRLSALNIPSPSKAPSPFLTLPRSLPPPSFSSSLLSHHTRPTPSPTVPVLSQQTKPRVTQVITRYRLCPRCPLRPPTPLFLSNKLSSHTSLAHANRFPRQPIRPTCTAPVFTERRFGLLHRQVRGQSRVRALQKFLLLLPATVSLIRATSSCHWALSTAPHAGPDPLLNGPVLLWRWSIRDVQLCEGAGTASGRGGTEGRGQRLGNQVRATCSSKESVVERRMPPAQVLPVCARALARSCLCALAGQG